LADLDPRFERSEQISTPKQSPFSAKIFGKGSKALPGHLKCSAKNASVLSPASRAASSSLPGSRDVERSLTFAV
jgi:hypothetical protein